MSVKIHLLRNLREALPRTPGQWLILFVLALAMIFYLLPVYVMVANGLKEAQGVSLSTMWNLPQSLSGGGFIGAWERLRPGGWLYVGIENRFGISYFLGAMDHSYLKYTSLLPRPLADWVTRRRRGHAYRTYTYSPIGYRRLLEGAGFGEIRFFGVMPTYSRPINYWPLGDGIPIQRFARVLFSEKPNTLSFKSRLAQRMVELVPPALLAAGAKFLVPHLLIVARRP
ncbi:MAG: hypothetical protein HUU16_04885 [Candidatus Omnitrophica bacterium]|nr:hypothetical protein [Candidatus Omnitrophota bacterium]